MPTVLNIKRQNEILKRSIATAGKKYTPDLHIPLPISDVFKGIGRTKEFFLLFKKELPNLRQNIIYINKEDIRKLSEPALVMVLNATQSFIDIIENFPNSGIASVPVQKIHDLSKEGQNAIHQLIDVLKKVQDIEKEEKNPEVSYNLKYHSEINTLYQLLSSMYIIDDFLDQKIVAAANFPLLLLNGEAGTGKTHLLCALSEERLERNLPTLFFLGEDIKTRNPWISILKQVGFNGSVDDFLNDLNSFAKSKRVRALIVIDAINETSSHIHWSYLMTVLKYPWIGLVLSVRSGFESDCISERMKAFIRIEHRGFVLKEWEAITKFFTEFNIPFPEIPLLLPEFTNPLFLTIFCKTYKNAKYPIKGHAGFTTIFEDYVIRQGDESLEAFGLQTGRVKGKHLVWDYIVKDMALLMSKKTTHRVSQIDLKNIIIKYIPKCNSDDFLLVLEKNFIVFKVPSYNSKFKITGYEYKFPYQKFSDHLIVRFLLKEFLNTKTPRKSFFKNTPLGEIVRQEWMNYGLIEALSIQLPEWLSGTDLISVTNSTFKKTEVAKRAFLASLLWRDLKIKKGKPETIKIKNIISYFNGDLRTHDNEIKSTLISLATIPNHPLNADYLTQHLLRLKMPERDRLWLPFLNSNYGNQSEDGSIDRIVHWAWKKSSTFPLSKESIRLTALTLSWFLASSNRFLRDKATKALVALLKDNIPTLIELLETFNKVDDLYIKERLYAVVYGCTLKSNSRDDILKLSLIVYRKIFKNGLPLCHISLRDYARETIKIGLKYNPALPINIKKITPPYKSSWPKNIPSIEYLQKKYESKKIKDNYGKEFHAYADIWNSVMHSNHGGIADFGNYVVSSAIGYWTDQPINEKNRPSTRKEIYQVFLNSLTSNQKVLWVRLQQTKKRFNKINRPLLWFMIEKESDKKLKKNKERQLKTSIKLKTSIEQMEKKFILLLLPKQKKVYINYVLPYQTHNNRVLPNLDWAAIERIIFSKIIKLGWTPELFSLLDRSVSSQGREAKKVERIGKKYQWIALHDVLARISDNYAFREERHGDDIGEYRGLWQIYDRDIDPSCLLSEISNDEDFYHVQYKNWRPTLSPIDWTRIISDLPNQNKLLHFKDTKGTEWFILKKFYNWQQPQLPGEKKYDSLSRSVWYILQSYLVRKKDAKHFFLWGKKQNFMGRWMPEGYDLNQIYLYEFPQSSAYQDSFNSKNEKIRWQKVYNKENRNKEAGFEVIITDENYSSSFGFDCSNDNNLGITLPAKELYDLLELRMSKVKEGYFENQNDELIVFDPVVEGKGSGGLFIEKRSLLKMLKKYDLELFWVSIGEKQIIGGRDKFYGRLEMGGIHWLKQNGTIFSHTYNKFLPPS